jgi:hypothetical protein
LPRRVTTKLADKFAAFDHLPAGLRREALTGKL